MGRIITDQIEFERIQRGALRFLLAYLNDQVISDAANWAEEDADFEAFTGRALPTIEVEEIEARNFYPGIQPSLLDAPIERYPNVSAFAWRADAQATNSDHQDRYLVNLAIEIMVKAVGTDDRLDVDENVNACILVGSRLDRTIAAAHKVLMSDDARSLGKIVPRIGNQPNIIKTDVFVRRQEKGHGPRWFWQGARLDYRIDQWVTYPGSIATT